MTAIYIYKSVLATYKCEFLLEPDMWIKCTRFQPGILLQCVGGSKLKKLVVYGSSQ